MVERQKHLIAERKARGRDTREHESLLEMFQQSLAIFEADLEALRKEGTRWSWHAQATPRVAHLSDARQGHYLGMVVAPDEESAIDRAMEEFGIEPARRFRVIVVPAE